MVIVMKGKFRDSLGGDTAISFAKEIIWDVI